MTDDFELPESHWLNRAHKKSIFNREDIEQSRICACFDCKRTFLPEKIKNWTDEQNP